MERETFLSAVYIIIKNNKGEILLGRRQNTNLWPGYLGLPAGHIDKNENAYDVLIREAKEELDIEIDLNDIIDTFVVNRLNEDLKPYYDIYFEISKYKGTIKINEPDKCTELVWKNINNLPNDMIEFEKIALNNNSNGIKFSTIYVKKEQNNRLYDKERKLNMNLIYNTINNKDGNASISYNISMDHLCDHIIDENDLRELDKFYNIICDAIDECNNMLVRGDDKLIKIFKKYLKYDFYEYLESYRQHYKDNIYIFNISSKESKEIVKENINFDLIADDDVPEIYDIDRKYIANDLDIDFYSDVCFLNNNEVLYSLRRFDGFLFCYQKYEDRKHKNIFKMNFSFDSEEYNKKTPIELFSYDEIIQDNNIFIDYFSNLLDKIDFYRLISINYYNGELLKKYSYRYSNLYINNKIIGREKFQAFLHFEPVKEVKDDIITTILDDIKNNRSNFYYFCPSKYDDYFLIFILELKNNKVYLYRDNNFAKKLSK